VTPLEYDRLGRPILGERRIVGAREVLDDPRLILPQQPVIQGAGQVTPQLPQVTTAEVTPVGVLADYTSQWIGSRGWTGRTTVVAAAQVLHLELHAKSAGGVLLERLQLASSGAGPFASFSVGVSAGRPFSGGVAIQGMQVGQYPVAIQQFTDTELFATSSAFLGFGSVIGLDTRPYANGRDINVFIPQGAWFGLELDAASAGTDAFWEVFFREFTAVTK
jgi:hypothetical protein